MIFLIKLYNKKIKLYQQKIDFLIKYFIIYSDLGGVMSIRRMMLPSGWYPKDNFQCKKAIKSFLSNYDSKIKTKLNCGIVPHAGWEFSGEVSAKVFYELQSNYKQTPELVIIFGGHMPPNSDPYILNYDFLETPLGEIAVNKDLVKELKEKFMCIDENFYFNDNTIEINLPFVKYFFPDSRILAIYPPADETAKLIADFISKNVSTAVYIGSADLTHYGPNYGFSPAGVGIKGYQWAKNNDNRLLEHIMALDIDKIFTISANEKSTCSPGSIVSIMHIAKKFNKIKGYLVQYKSSYDIYPSSSFVGYGGVVF